MMCVRYVFLGEVEEQGEGVDLLLQRRELQDQASDAGPEDHDAPLQSRWVGGGSWPTWGLHTRNVVITVIIMIIIIIIIVSSLVHACVVAEHQTLC